MEKTCITCSADGHTYLECPRVNFADLLCAALGAPNLSTGENAAQQQSRITKELEAIEAERNAKNFLNITDDEYRKFKAWQKEKHEAELTTKEQP